MEVITLERILKDLLDLKREVKELKDFIHEDFELPKDVILEIENFRKRQRSEFISNKEMEEEFGV